MSRLIPAMSLASVELFMHTTKTRTHQSATNNCEANVDFNSHPAIPISLPRGPSFLNTQRAIIMFSRLIMLMSGPSLHRPLVAKLVIYQEEM